MEAAPLPNNGRPARKHRFAPKAPVRKSVKLEVKEEKLDAAAEAAMATNLLRQFNERSKAANIKVETKGVAAVQVAFGGHGSAPSSIRSYGFPKSLNGRKGEGSVDIPGTIGKEYQEPWDYYSNYPVTLPLRRPYSGNPEILDELEFGPAAENATHDSESIMNPAVGLGLSEENVEPTLLFLQLPHQLPMLKRSATEDGKAVEHAKAKLKALAIADLPAGYMGKLIVYVSGAVKLKLGDILFDVTPGVQCEFAQYVVAVDTKEKQSGVVSEISNRATITLDVNSILSDVGNL